MLGISHKHIEPFMASFILTRNQVLALNTVYNIVYVLTNIYIGYQIEHME